MQDEEVELTEDGLVFKANGDGVKGHNLYGIDLQFYLPVDPEVCPISYISPKERKKHVWGFMPSSVSKICMLHFLSGEVGTLTIGMSGIAGFL